jgi:hypothetical protein
MLSLLAARTVLLGLLTHATSTTSDRPSRSSRARASACQLLEEIGQSSACCGLLLVDLYMRKQAAEGLMLSCLLNHAWGREA